MKKYNQNNAVTLPIVRLVLGICAIILSLIFSVEFVSNGASGAAIISAIVFCVITEFAKVAFSSDLAWQWETGQYEKVFFNVLIVTLLFTLSISAAVFCLTIAPTKEQTLLADFDKNAARLEQSISDKKAQLAACNPNYISKCVSPRTAELSKLESELNTLNAKNKAIEDAKASAVFWQKIADYVGSTPDNLLFNFSIGRAVLLDLLGLIFISQYTASKRLESLDNAVYTQEKELPNADVNQQQNSQYSALTAEIERLKELASLQQRQLENLTADRQLESEKKD